MKPLTTCLSQEDLVPYFLWDEDLTVGFVAGLQYIGVPGAGSQV